MTSWTGAHQVPLPMGFSRQETLKLVATFFSGGSYKRRDQTNVSYTGRRILYHWSTWEAEIYIHFRYISDQFSWVAQSCLTLCDPTDGSTIGHPVHHQLPELTQTQVCWFGDVIQPSHPLSSPSPPAFKLSQHQVFFPLNQFFSSRGQSTGVSASAGILPTDIQDWFPLWWTG